MSRTTPLSRILLLLLCCGISTYAATRTGAGTFNENRNYGYNSRNQLLTESYAPASGQSETLTYEFDSGKRGIRTSAKIGTGAPTNWEITATTVQDIARVTEETSTAEPIIFTATGNAFGAASVDVAIDGFGQGRAEHTGWQGTGDWSKLLRVPHGSHEMTATAHHPSGQFSPDASHTFTANITQQTITSGYDASGNVTTRTLSGGRVQTLTWDANDRLIRLEERDSNSDGYDWIAVYDGLGRRARTVMTDVKAGAALPNALTTESTFDPEVEFLEIATTINGKRTWKIHGPDLDGRYGGLQGIGGLEATIAEEGSVSTGILSDVFGNAVGTISGTTLTWNPNRAGSYGALPGNAMPTPNETVSLAQATGWRGKTADATGFYNLGARYYEPNGGRFLSADPMGHSASISLYDYANGDPINFVDPDGRIGKAIGGALGIQQSTSSSITYRAPSYRVVANSFTSSNSISGMSVLSGAFNMIPVLGTVKSYIELSSGNDLFTGARISQSQAAFNVLASALPFTATSIARFGVQSAGRSVATSFASAEARVISGASGSVGSVQKTTTAGFNPKFWNSSSSFSGNKVFQRNDLFDTQLVSSWKVRGRTVTGTNVERMASGRAPVGYDGQAVNLHHLTQTQKGAIAEVSGGMHQK